MLKSTKDWRVEKSSSCRCDVAQLSLLVPIYPGLHTWGQVDLSDMEIARSETQVYIIAIVMAGAYLGVSEHRGP